MFGGGDDLVRVKEEVEEGMITAGGLGVFAEVKEEMGDDEGCVGEVMNDFLRRREGARVGTSSHGGLVPGVEVLPGGRIPGLLGFSEQQAVQMIPSRALGPFVPYSGEAGVAAGRRRSEQSFRGRGRGKVRSRAVSRGGSKRPTQSLAERRKKRKRPAFGSGGPIRLLSNINREARNRPLQMVCRENIRSVAPFNRRRGSLSLFGEGHCYRPVSWHREQYDKSSEGFVKTGRYHPEDARLKATGIFDAIVEDLEVYKIPPPYWPEPLTFSDFYKSSSSSDSSGSPGRFGLFTFVALSEVWGVQGIVSEGGARSFLGVKGQR